MPNDRPDTEFATPVGAALPVVADPGKRVHFQVTPVARKPLCKQNDYLGKSHKRFTKDRSLVTCAKCLATLKRQEDEAEAREIERTKPGPKPLPAPRRKDHLVGMKVDDATESRIAAMAAENGESIAAFLRRAVDKELRLGGQGVPAQLSSGFSRVIEELDRRIQAPSNPGADRAVPSLGEIYDLAERADRKVTPVADQLTSVLAQLAQMQKALVLLAAGQARHETAMESLVKVFGALGATDDVGALGSEHATEPKAEFTLTTRPDSRI